MKIKKSIAFILSALCITAVSGSSVFADVVFITEPSSADAGIVALIAGVPAVIAAIIIGYLMRKKNKK